MKKLAKVGTQLENVLLAEEVEKMQNPTVVVAPKDYFIRAEKGIKVLDLVESDLEKQI